MPKNIGPQLNLNFALHDTIHCLTPGLFRSLKRGERTKAKLDVAYEFGDGERIEFSGPEPLGDDDLRVLQGLIALAGPSGHLLTQFPETVPGMSVRRALELQWGAISENGMVVKGSYRNLAKEIGYADIDSSKTVRDCIERMWKVSVIAEKGGKRVGFRLLSQYQSDDNDGSLYVALNPQITAAIVGDIRHTRINMAEVRAIKLGGTRLVHQRLCAWIDPGKSKKVSLETICGYIWTEAEAEDETVKKRKTRAKPVLAELASIGWGINEYAKGKYEITRPALAV